MQVRLNAGRMTAIAVLAPLLVTAAGCGGGGAEFDARAGLGCVDDSAECIARRRTTLRHLVTDQSRTWVKEPATAEAYASGVRLFAFRAKKNELTCDELAHARREAEAARGVLSSAGARLTPAQVSRGALLAGEVGRELQSELSRRCKKG
ncbi:MAG TPA: hypothetical protein VJ045_07920 [Hyphomicrobiaceae bacterium]|nr:hypothetical protein [Hyphomicrobiaceae bacterium]